jgi:pyridoxamine 5'-phosphate oxidase
MTEPHTPWDALSAWWPEAERAEPRVHDAAQLATVDEHGRPTLRTVLVKDWGPEQGLVFFTNYTSRKARQLDATGLAALLLHWKALERQVIAEGAVERAEEATSDAYFATRPRGSQLGAWASDQSSLLHDREALERRLAEVAARFEGGPVPRPPFWGGYHLRPVRFEFWQGRPDRLHHRAEWLLQDGAWVRGLLYP